ncbi:insulinase family protein [Desulfospira joergensenii]|uniref:insulinase family protein n=1 Tax=Desulfospira joergensenii TaxID=53329 RepID=UPI0003B46A72|nr:insulinase family protein [Desulfospira joergensenii]
MGSQTAPQLLEKNQEIEGYRVLRVVPLPSIDSKLIHLVHEKTKAVHIHIANQDKENTFGVFFRTVPKDSTGVAHILEHTVLCGSEKFKVRDPFFSMIKRSLSTFMNAFTASDWTMYPFSTQNQKDYYNLMDVYLDAAFFPDIDELSFKQEGHRLNILDREDKEVELEYKGVVYNEMKGAMSSPSQVMGRALFQCLYPDTTYCNNSGGEPGDIPKLTWEGLKAFHARYYHPSNSFFYTYGNLPLEESLAFISQKVLNRFDYLDVDSKVPSQPRWDKPRQEKKAFPFSDSGEAAKKFQGCVAWLTCDARDSFEILVLTVLEQVLLGNSASPLRKALIDSKLGSALSDSSGFDPDNRDAMFVCGLKDISGESVEKVEEIIFSTLQELVDKGIDRSLIDSAIHQIEFHRKEITNTPYPFGIKLLLSFAGTLIHDGDPVACINIDEDIERLNRELDQGRFLEGKIQEYFIENPHRMRFTLEPNPDLEQNQVKEIREELKARLKTLSPEELDRIREDARALEALQEKEEDVTVLPTLELEDVPPEIEMIRPDSLEEVSFATVYDKATSGILYFTCPVGAGSIDPGMFPLVPFFCKAFTNAGTRESSYVSMAEKMDLYTGGVSMSPFSGSYFSKQGGYHSFLALQGKALDRNVEKLFELIREFVLEYGFHDHDRLKSLLLQYQASMEASIVSAGHRYAISLSARHLSKSSYINELWHGIAQYQHVQSIVEKLELPKSGEKVLQDMDSDFRRIAGALFRKNNFKPAVIGSRDSILVSDKNIGRIYQGLPDGSQKAFHTPKIEFDEGLPRDGWYTNTAVSFVGQSFRTVRITHEDSPGLAVISKLLRSLYLHREIREKGGAYGGFAMYNTEEGIFSFGSYRDPHIKQTLDVYKNACDFIMKGEYTQTDVKEAILQVCSDIDKPETPGPAAMKAFYRDITKLSDEIRRNFKDALLGLDKERILKIAEKYFSVDDSLKGVSVISSKALLESANQTLESENQKPLKLNKI